MCLLWGCMPAACRCRLVCGCTAFAGMLHVPVSAQPNLLVTRAPLPSQPLPPSLPALCRTCSGKASTACRPPPPKPPRSAPTHATRTRNASRDSCRLPCCLNQESTGLSLVVAFFPVVHTQQLGAAVCTCLWGAVHPLSPCAQTPPLLCRPDMELVPASSGGCRLCAGQLHTQCVAPHGVRWELPAVV